MAVYAIPPEGRYIQLQTRLAQDVGVVPPEGLYIQLQTRLDQKVGVFPPEGQWLPKSAGFSGKKRKWPRCARP